MSLVLVIKVESISIYKLIFIKNNNKVDNLANE